MRLSLATLPTLLLPLLVLWVSFAGWGLFKTSLALATWFLLRLVFVNIHLGNTKFNPAVVSVRTTFLYKSPMIILHSLEEQDHPQHPPDLALC